MTLADTAQPPHEPVSAPPARRRGRRLAIGISIALLVVAGGTVAGTYYYDSVPLIESNAAAPVTSVPPLVEKPFVAAIDPDFYAASDSLITRRYVVLGFGAEKESGLRTRIMAHKAETSYTKTEILDGYLSRADYGRGAVGLDAAAQTYFAKPLAQLSVAEAALLAVQLHPDRPEPKAGWNQILDTMVELGWLTPADRTGLAFPG
ncbi:transglycosylase domain-containing protein [Winogradskya humida]|uniref:Glycosyl transferase family 51 domain-containing protein n=1 Tax=Winogradskya humida TaxID=113566 RepID=A0ABQ3ZU46_9ACTN|nr:transglycosylase domain-containing protein [Actinoplanes humidus]GIE21682.1 hypothetical protein Ahu01nite_047840 [Actinoplanes humidus]